MALLSLVIVLASQLPHAGSIGFVMISLVAIGLLDDWRGIPSSIRLLCYVVASVALAGSLPSAQLGGAVGFFALSLGIAWCINLVNFMDGIDGLVVVQALCRCGRCGYHRRRPLDRGRYRAFGITVLSSGRLFSAASVV